VYGIGFGGPIQNGRPARPMPLFKGALPDLNQLMPVTKPPNGTTNETATPISQLDLVLSHHGPKTAAGCRARLIKAATPTPTVAMATTQMQAKTTKKKIGNTKPALSTTGAYGGARRPTWDNRARRRQLKLRRRRRGRRWECHLRDRGAGRQLKQGRAR
jgi:hypothetical protein